MNKIVKSFTEDPSFVMLKQTENCYIFKDNKTCHELKISVIERNVELMKEQRSKSESINDIDSVILAMDILPIINIAEELSNAVENGKLESSEELSN